MYALSITFKVLAWYLALRNGDSGPRSRPWMLGLFVAAVFSAFDLDGGFFRLHGAIILCASYLVAALVLLHIYYRIHNIALSLLVGAIGTAIMLFGVPILAGVVSDYWAPPAPVHR